MQIGIAAHSGEFDEKMRLNVRKLTKGLKEKCKDPILILGGYWGLMKEVVDNALEVDIPVVLILPIEQEEAAIPSKVVKIKSGMEFRARSVPLVRSSDVVIALGGGVGTHIEIAMAYAMGKPTFILTNTGYSTDNLQNAFPEYLDNRKTVKLTYVNDVEKLVEDISQIETKIETRKVVDIG